MNTHSHTETATDAGTGTMAAPASTSRINSRARLGRPAAIGLAVLTAAATATALAPAANAAPHSAPAPVSSEPAFLAPNELPPHRTSAWYASDVTPGTPDPLPFCFGPSLPGATSVHRNFWTEYDTGAVQVTVVGRDQADAKSLAALFNKAIRTCADQAEQEDPDVKAEFRDYGRINVEEGANVYGIHTAHASGPSDINLFSVGRDGRTVTVVKWGQMGNFQHAQVADFKRTTTTAVNKLY
ncbi:hypothetical protein [Streptomyces zagrosensis]|uniref:PknH-like extracellular domain-containing protein n=1 Tax=Streptomyces zagrosensis TaxID=1042984 RepID=A0A7W9Q463_9ACTN|nr:hypothetical protein [Streptomyces zagrosensis]MBB5933205.1 hypothetical protein [Streptomyces zagrosensis]